jgi:hypothetical protein
MAAERFSKHPSNCLKNVRVVAVVEVKGHES